MKNLISYDYLNNTDIHLYQRKDMFRINTDTTLLGEYMQINQDETVLDIGTNNGALLLYASQFTQNTLYGVDILSEAIELCNQNLLLNQIANYRLFNCPVQELDINPVDVIVCNPPYFRNSLKNENQYLVTARHEEYLSLDELFIVVNRLLKDEGRFYLIHRANRVADIEHECMKNNLFLNQKCYAKDPAHKTAESILLTISKVDKEIASNQIIIRRKQK